MGLGALTTIILSFYNDHSAVPTPPLFDFFNGGYRCTRIIDFIIRTKTIKTTIMAENILDILRKYNSTAVIFDLDGTILDNNAFHLKSWKEYLRRINREMSDEEYNKNINGRTNRDVVKHLYGNDLSEDDIWKYTNEKALYRGNVQALYQTCKWIN